MEGKAMTQVTIVGNLTADPELRFIPNGAAVANFTIASTPRINVNGEWKDGETLFLRCSLWREAAENLTESLHRGDRVIATGKLKSRSWDDNKTGEKRTVTEMDVDEIGPSLHRATAKVEKTTATGSRSNAAASKPVPVADDPWGTATAATDEPPF